MTGSTPPPDLAGALPAALALALPRLREMARQACERSLIQLAAAGEASSNVFERDGLLIAHFELNRQQGTFLEQFSDALLERVRRDIGGTGSAASSDPVDWQSLSLVDDREVEVQVAADRFAMQLAQAAEAEFRQLQAFGGAMYPPGHDEESVKLPLRAESLGFAALRAIGAVSSRDDVHRLLESTFARTMSAALPELLRELMGQWRQAGIREQAMGLRNRASAAGPASQRGGLDDTRESQTARSASDSAQMPLDQGARARHEGASADTFHGSSQSPLDYSGGSSRGGPRPSGGSAFGALSASFGQVGTAMMGVIRRLAHIEPPEPQQTSAGALQSGLPSSHGQASGHGAYGGGTMPGVLHSQNASDFGPLPMANVIHAHREELRQVANGQLDLMVIDVVATLFDAILSDPKVPPQMARQIGRLQLPVLRAALGDPSFFSSRRHPVRRFVNRLASLGSAFEDFASEEAQRFLQRVRELVQTVVEGDFERMQVYEAQLEQLEAFVAEQAQREAKESGDAARALAQREAVVRIHQRYAGTVQGALKSLAAPDFLRDFVAQVWSLVLVQSALAEPVDAARCKRFRDAARDVFLSVQPKAGVEQRKAFLAQLPPLMKVLNEGLDFIAWPAAARSAFFGALLPAHARSLKGEVRENGRVEGISTLDYNLMARQLESLFAAALPTLNQLPAPNPMDVPDIQLDEQQAKDVGLVEDAAVDWTAPVPEAPAVEPTPSVEELKIHGLPAPQEAPDPAAGKGLADHVQIGFAYQMLLEGEWQKVRLNHISPGRTFFVFTRGKRHKQAISLTHRMLVKLCEGERFRAFESAALIERATARARKQLAALTAGASATIR